MSAPNPDRLYDLLPAVHRMRDADRGYPLRALLQVISEQVNVVDEDIAQLYENWFIETCQDWVVPYIGDLVGYTSLYSTGEQSGTHGKRGLSRERLLIPRREVANTIRFRRRKGTLSVLEDLAEAVAGWPARAVEYYRLLSVTQNINYLQLKRGRTADVRDGNALQDLGTAFEELAHTAAIRCVNARRSPGIYSLPGVGLFVWRLNAYSVTKAPAFYEDDAPNCYFFSALGNDTVLYNKPQPPGTQPAGPLNFPGRITRRGLESFEASEGSETVTNGIPYYYGQDKSFAIWAGTPPSLIDPASLVVADLSGWTYRPVTGQVAIDPVLGRFAFPPTQARRQGVWVSYHYGFSADIGGGEYKRTLSQPQMYSLYQVGPGEEFTRINDALNGWLNDKPKNAVIEITNSGVYVEPIDITLQPGQTLQLRAANGVRPVLRLLNWQTSAPDDLTITGATTDPSASGASAEPLPWFTLDGIMVTGRGVQVQGAVAGVVIRHCTLVPGWGLECDCGPSRPTEPSIELDGTPDCLRIEHSIVGSIEVNRDEVREDPCSIVITDSIVDATSQAGLALAAPEKLCAYAVVTVRRSTIFGQFQAHAFELAENSIFMGLVRDCRRQQGCMRFCYCTPGSRTPRRYECQPDMVERAAVALAQKDNLSTGQRQALIERERLRVEPEFNSVRYGAATYCQLSARCAVEIKAGAEDKSEMGVFHDLYQPQREANLRTRLNEYTPAGMSAGIIFAS